MAVLEQRLKYGVIQAGLYNIEQHSLAAIDKT